ncbi:MAG TPA: methyltransferase [Acidimicrobiales bacterium]|nr:methyltransferase [Acidimicrobiales bacterium]
MTAGASPTGPLDAASPAPIWRLIQGLTAYFSVVAGDELGVFAALADGPACPAVLARRCGAHEGRLASLLDGLVAAGVLERDGERYALTPTAAAYLVPGPGYLGALLRTSPGPLENWPALAATVRGAPPPRDVGADGSFHAELVRATFPAQLAAARATVRELDLRPARTAARILDLGAGGAPWTIALLEAWPGATAVVNDLPPVAEVAAEKLAAAGLQARASILEGSYFEVGLEADAFDVVVLAHVCRAEGEAGARRLVARAARALCPGGELLLADYPVDEDGRGPAQAQLLGVTMTANTRQGRAFTWSQARAWAEDAGLGALRVAAPLPPTSVLLARKGG